MPYTPTLADINDAPTSNAQYAPSLKDIEDLDVPQGTTSQPSGLEKFNNFLQGNVINPTEALAHGAGNFLSDVGAAVYAPADYLYGTHFANDIREGQQARNEAFEQRFPNDLGAKILSFAGEQVPAFYMGSGIAGDLLKGAKFVGKPLLNAVANNAISGGIVGGIESPDDQRLQGTVAGGLLGAGAGAVGQGLDKLAIQPLAGLYGRTAIPGIISKAKDLAGSRFLSNIIDNNANWTTARASASNLDNEMNANNSAFDASPYHNYIDNFISKVENLSPAKQESYKDALDFAQQAKNFAPQSFDDVMHVSQNLNTFLKNYFRPKGLNTADYNSKQFINGLKDNLSSDVLDANSAYVNPDSLDQFKNDWAQANASHPIALGSKYLRDIFEHGATSKNIETLYGRLSNQQRQAKFGGTPEQPYLESANNALLALGKPSPQSPNKWEVLGHKILGFSLPGAFGVYGARQAGLPWEDSLGVGLGTSLATKGAGKLVSKFATPQLLNRAVQLAKQGRANKGLLTNVMLQNNALPLVTGATQ